LGVAAALADRYGLIPPDHSGIFGVGETLTYAAQRILMSHHSLAREFNRSEISKVAPINGKPPETDLYQRLLAGGFADWRLTVDGLVARPSTFSLGELKRFPSQTNITHQACEEGWSFIAEWTGVRLSYALNLVGVSTKAKYVVFFPFDDAFDSVDMADAWHPQTMLAYGMNGRELPTEHGAPLRVRAETAWSKEQEIHLAHSDYGYSQKHRQRVGSDRSGTKAITITSAAETIQRSCKAPGSGNTRLSVVASAAPVRSPRSTS
jgi:hypothetical protein